MASYGFGRLIFALIVLGISYTKLVNGITNGSPTEPHEVPYQVFLVIDSNMGIRWCSGTLITKQYVLTSGYCVDGATSVMARLGVYNRTEFEDTQVNLTGTEWLQHPDFIGEYFINDVGLVKLEAEAELNEFIQLAPLLGTDQVNTNWEGQSARLTGWGLPSYLNYESTDVLYETFAPVISFDACHNRYSFITNAQLCTSGENVTGYCTGDQGGPLVIDGVQVGIIAGGDERCQWTGGNWPSVHTWIGAYLNWIEENSQDARLTGWGLPNYLNSPSTDLLYETITPVISENECYGYFNFTTDNQLCTSGYNYRGYCNGDQGGPLVIDGVQVGIIAGGDKVCQWDGGEWPTIHTRLGVYLYWIQENSDYVNH